MPSTLPMDQQQCLLTGTSCTQCVTQQTAAELNAWRKPMCSRANCNKMHLSAQRPLCQHELERQNSTDAAGQVMKVRAIGMNM